MFVLFVLSPSPTLIPLYGDHIERGLVPFPISHKSDKSVRGFILSYIDSDAIPRAVKIPMIDKRKKTSSLILSDSETFQKYIAKIEFYSQQNYVRHVGRGRGKGNI